MISCHNLTRRFGDFTAVNQVSFEIPSGMICALLGPNGAVKSTLMKMLTGLLEPTSGEASVAGFNRRAHPHAGERAPAILPRNLCAFLSPPPDAGAMRPRPNQRNIANRTLTRADRI